MKELLEPGRAPNCNYVHEQALTINDAYDGILGIEAQQRQLQAESSDIEQRQATLTLKISEQILDREFLRDGVVRQGEDYESRLMSEIWHLNNVTLGHKRQTNASIDRIKAPLQDLQRNATENIDAHTAKYHRHGNMGCSYDKDYMTPWEGIRTRTRAIGSLLLRKITAKLSGSAN